MSQMERTGHERRWELVEVAVVWETFGAIGGHPCLGDQGDIQRCKPVISAHAMIQRALHLHANPAHCEMHWWINAGHLALNPNPSTTEPERLDGQYVSESRPQPPESVTELATTPQ
jgi:hypothetical protein